MSNVWQEVKDKVDLETVVSQYLSLTPSGSNLKAKCPFHNDKSPSMVVSKPKQIWHCFGCGAGGDVFSFVAQIENLDRQGALEILARQAGVSLSKKRVSRNADATSPESSPSSYTKGLHMLEWAAQLYHQILLRELQTAESPVKQYLHRRHLSMEQIQTFQLGYAPPQNVLLDMATKKDQLDLDLLFQTGLIAAKSGQEIELGSSLKSRSPGILKDKFKDRLIMPIQNERDQVVGFTGRVFVSDPNRPKYLNSPQTEWFNKSEILFGLNLARKHLYQSRELILVEGQMDVISAYKAGLHNTVASSGTSITDSQIQKIAKLVPNLTLALDNDEAGRIAARKVFLLGNKYGLNVHQIIIPEAFKDIDEFLNSQEKPVIKKIFFLDFYYYQKHNELVSADSQVQKAVIHDCLELINSLDQISQEQYFRKLSEITKISLSSLEATLRLLYPPIEKVTPSLTIQPDNTKLSTTQAIFISNLKIILALYEFTTPNRKDHSYFRSFTQKLWFLLGNLELLPPALNFQLEEVVSQNKPELTLIWDEDVHKKLIQRPSFPMEIVKSANNFIMPHRPKLQLDPSLGDLLFTYDEGLQELVAMFNQVAP